VHFFVDALRAIAYGGGPFSIDMNALWAIAYGGGPFSIDMNALQAIAYGGCPFSIDHRFSCDLFTLIHLPSDERQSSVTQSLILYLTLVC